MWSVRLSLLCVLGRYSDAEEEMQAFGELEFPDLCYQYNRHNYPGRVGGFAAVLLFWQNHICISSSPYFSPCRQHGSILHACAACRAAYVHAWPASCSQQTMRATEHHPASPSASAGRENTAFGGDAWCQWDRRCSVACCVMSDHCCITLSCVVAVRVWRQRLARVKCGLAGCLLAMSVSWSLLVDPMLGLGHFWFVLPEDVALAREVLHSLPELLPEKVAEIQSAIGRVCLQVRSCSGFVWAWLHNLIGPYL